MRYLSYFRIYVPYLNTLSLRIPKLNEKWKGLLWFFSPLFEDFDYDPRANSFMKYNLRRSLLLHSICLKLYNSLSSPLHPLPGNLLPPSGERYFPVLLLWPVDMSKSVRVFMIHPSLLLLPSAIKTYPRWRLYFHTESKKRRLTTEPSRVKHCHSSHRQNTECVIRKK